MNPQVNNLIVFGSGKTTFCKLLNTVYTPFCRNIINKPETESTGHCKIYKVHHTEFNTRHTMNIIDTPHDITNILQTYIMVEPTYMVYLFDLSKQEELDSLNELVRASRIYYDCTDKIFIGINRGEKLITDEYISAVIGRFNTYKYIEMDLIETDSHQFTTVDLLSTFSKLTEHVYSGSDIYTEEVYDNDQVDDENDNDQVDDENDNDNGQVYNNVYGDQISDAVLAYMNYTAIPIIDIFILPSQAPKPKIMKNSKFVAQDYYSRNKDKLKCCICFDDIRSIESFVYTWCGHEYCADCYPKMEECFCKTTVEL